MVKVRRVSKTGTIQEDGGLAIRFSFVDGKEAFFKLNPKMFQQFALHGALQKYGDHIAGTVNTDDAIAELEELHAQLGQGKWTSRKEGSGSGASLLVAALAEYRGKTPEEIKAWFEATEKTAEDKAKIRRVPGVRKIIDRLTLERNEKLGEVDESELLGGLEG